MSAAESDPWAGMTYNQLIVAQHRLDCDIGGPSHAVCSCGLSQAFTAELKAREVEEVLRVERVGYCPCGCGFQVSAPD